MQEMMQRRAFPELRQLVVEASQALACLDANRLEELALSCQALNRDLSHDLSRDLPSDLSPDLSRDSARKSAEQSTGLANQAREAAGDMAAFAGVLNATRANLEVMSRLRALRAGSSAYGAGPAAAGCGWTGTGSTHGDH